MPRARHGKREGRHNHGAPCAALLAGTPTVTRPAYCSHYMLLGVQRSASPAEIRRAYLRRLVTVHPDKGGDPAAFQALQAAFSVLSDREQRLVYNERLEREGTSGSSRSSGADGTGGRMAAAVVHGQTQGSLQQDVQQPCAAPQRAACAGQPARGSTEMQDATAAIRGLQASGSGASQLAAAHLRRAQLHQAAGALHHALFDAEEALRVQPKSDEAAELVAELLAAAEAQPAAGGGGLYGNGSKSSEEEDEDLF